VDAHEHLERVCQAIGLLLKELAHGRCSGVISEESFVDTVLKIEAEQVIPGGFTLTASNTLDDWTVFKIKMNGSGETCAAFEFLPETGEFRRVGTECHEEPRHSPPKTISR
jgi:hypothetical protein